MIKDLHFRNTYSLWFLQIYDFTLGHAFYVMLVSLCFSHSLSKSFPITANLWTFSFLLKNYFCKPIDFRLRPISQTLSLGRAGQLTMMPPHSSLMDDDPGIMSEAETSSTR